MKALAARLTPRLMLLVVCFAGVALAQPRVDPKKKAAAASKAEAKAAAKKPEDRKGPAKLDAREAPKVEDVEREAIADQKRDESIESLKKIIPKIEDGNPQKADMYFQLSELYWEKSRFLYRKEMLAYFAAQAEKPDAKDDHRESELYRSETTRLYETVLREYPTYDRKDEVLFNLAYNLYDTGKREAAVKRYEELLHSYPSSKFVPDAYVQLGNHYFEVANVLDKARGYYEKAFASSNPRIKSYALYKLAWCDFNNGEHEKALKKLQDTVEFSESQAKERSFTDLKNEALNDSVRVFVELDRSDEAITYFRAHAGKKKQVALISRLADGLQGAGHHESAIKAYRMLLAENPAAEGAPDYQQSIIKSYEALRQRDRVRAELKTLAELYRPGSTWWAANASKKEVLCNGFNVAEEAMRTMVSDYHQEAQRTKQVETYKLARDIYQQYVEAFASGDDEAFIADQAFNQKFYYAEILWALEEWEAAAKQYDGVAAFKIPARPEAKEAANEHYRQQASYDSILAYAKLVKIERGTMQRSELKDGQKVEENKKKGTVEKSAKLQKRSAKELEEQPLTATEQALTAACDQYNALYPKNPDEIDVAYQAAVIFYDKSRFVEAARRFGEIILRYPEERRSQEAAELSMAVLEEKEEWLELNKLSRQFKANTRLARPGSEFARRVAGIVEGSQYKYVDEVIYKKEKDPKRALKAFLAHVDEFPRSENADRALVYAMLISVEASELDTAAVLGERLLKDYPLSVFDLRVKYRLAKLYEQTANFARSAAMYEEFVATYDLATGDKAGAKVKGISTVELKALKDEGKKREREALIAECNEKKDSWVQNAVFNAGFWYEGVGQFDKAIASYGRYLTRYKDEKDAPQIAFNVGLVLAKEGKVAEALKSFEGYLTTYARDPRVTDGRRLEAKYREFLLQGKLKNASEQERLAREFVAAHGKLKDEEKKSDRAMLASAHARFTLLEPAFKTYTELKFKRLGTFKSDLQGKQKRLAELSNQYLEVLKAGNPEYGIASLTRIGLLYADFATDIGELPDPPGLDEDQLGLFHSELETQYIFPVEQKAVEALEKALAKSYELSIYNEWTILAQDKLNRYKPGLYGKARELPYRGSEFFVTAGTQKTPDLPKDEAPSSAAAPGPGAGAR